ncbi:hypothetical protein WJX74_006630 [Apatococcus lobatus]|uniref:G domain-containing protein n=2 Tax=Apatococcus TaxID=904362 RepID=A0AAW1SZD3_9CHLO
MSWPVGNNTRNTRLYCWKAAPTLFCTYLSRRPRRPQQQALRPAAKVTDIQSAATNSNPSGTCYGCGAGLHTEQPGSAGYINQEVYAVKKQHRQLQQVLCERCQALSHGGMVPGVLERSSRQQDPPGGHSAAQMRRLVSPEELKAQLAGVRDTKAVVVLLVDLLDASGSFLNRVRDLVRSNPVLLIGTKADLLPAGTDLAAVEEWLLQMADFRRLTAIGACIMSSRTRHGLSDAARAILTQRQGRDVYVVGAANVGKSAFVRSLMQEMGSMSSRHFDAAAAEHRRRLPVESPMPGTTLGPIALHAFASGGTLFDMPGLHVDHRLLHLLSPSDLQALHPRKRIRPYIPPPPSAFCQTSRRDSRCSASYHWGSLARIDVAAAPASLQLVFYGVAALKVRAEPLQRQGNQYESDHDQPAHSRPDPPQGLCSSDSEVGQSTVAARGGLRLAREVHIEGRGHDGQIADLAISGLAGWIALHAGAFQGPIKLQIWCPMGIEAFSRPPLPMPDPFIA